MRFGYSMLLAEAVEASELDYKDCEEFLVVCPSCREGLFKKIRPRQNLPDTHFLSHFIASAEVEDCELRVSRMTRDQITRTFAESQGQSIEGFTQRFYNLIVDAVSASTSPSNQTTRARLDDMLRNPNFNQIFREYREWRLWEHSGSGNQAPLAKVLNKRFAQEREEHGDNRPEIVKHPFDSKLFDSVCILLQTSSKTTKAYRDRVDQFYSSALGYLHSQHGTDSQKLLIAAVFEFIVIPNIGVQHFKDALLELSTQLDEKSTSRVPFLKTAATMLESKLKFNAYLKREKLDSNPTKLISQVLGPKSVASTADRAKAATKMAFIMHITYMEAMLLKALPLTANGRKHFGLVNTRFS